MIREYLRKLSVRLFDPIDIAPLVLFRIGFGILMLWEVWRYFHYDRIGRYYMEPTFYFHYFGFEWLSPLPGDGMIALFHFVGLLSILIMLGAFYRLSMALFCLCFTYIFLLDQAQYLNHFYLISLISFLMIFIPAHRAISVDALLRPSLRSETAPNWALWLLRGQMTVVYVFGGIAKINADWLGGEPLRTWMAERTDFPIIGALFTEEWMVYLFSYGGMLLDLLVVPLLLWPRTRWVALLFSVGFHLTNDRLFNIGIFPWFAIAATLLFLPPHWFRVFLFRTSSATPPYPPPQYRYGLILSAMAVYFAIQIMLPLRHWIYPDNPSWSEEGHNLAWHMRLRDKDGTLDFYASDPSTGSTWQLWIEPYLTIRQEDQMMNNPQMILRFAHHLADMLQEDYPNVRIHVRAMTSLNSRAPQLLIDPTADLAQQPYVLLPPADWILPLKQSPYPSPAQPSLLVSRRQDGVIMLVNMTEERFPLAEVTLSYNGVSLVHGSAFGVEALMPDECVVAHTPTADLLTLFAPCNETGSRVLLTTQQVTGELRIETTTHTQICQSVVCVITSDRVS